MTTAAFQLVPQGPVISDVGDGIGEIDVISFRVLLSKVEVGSIPAQGIYPATAVFLFFLSVNLVGALLGYGISKVLGIREPKWWFLGFVLRTVLGMVFLAAGVWLSTIGEVVRTSPVDAYFYSYDPYPFMSDALAFLIFGVVWLMITVGEFTLEHH